MGIILLFRFLAMKTFVFYPMAMVVYTLLSVLHVPILHYNLLSLHELCRLGLSLDFVDDQFLVRDKHKKVLLEGVVNTSLYKISVDSLLLTTNSSLALWHARFGHLNIDYLQKATKMVDGLPALGGHQDLCNSYVKGKKHREAFPTQAS